MFRGDLYRCHLSDAKVRVLGIIHASHILLKIKSVEAGINWKSTEFMLGYFNTTTNNGTSLKTCDNC